MAQQYSAAEPVGAAQYQQNQQQGSRVQVPGEGCSINLGHLDDPHLGSGGAGYSW
eukprot:gene4737-4987_t